MCTSAEDVTERLPQGVWTLMGRVPVASGFTLVSSPTRTPLPPPLASSTFIQPWVALGVRQGSAALGSRVGRVLGVGEGPAPFPPPLLWVMEPVPAVGAPSQSSSLVLPFSVSFPDQDPACKLRHSKCIPGSFIPPLVLPSHCCLSHHCPPGLAQPGVAAHPLTHTCSVKRYGHLPHAGGRQVPFRA